MELRVVCSKGTYIRALARDIGLSLNSGAYLIGLRRTRIGKYTLDKSIELAELAETLSAYFQDKRNTNI